MWAIMEMTRQVWSNWYNSLSPKKQFVTPLYGLYLLSETEVTTKTPFQNENKCRKVLLKGDWK